MNKGPSNRGCRSSNLQTSRGGNNSNNPRGRGRGRNSFFFQSRTNWQVCNKLSHISLDCYNLIIPTPLRPIRTCKPLFLLLNLARIETGIMNLVLLTTSQLILPISMSEQMSIMVQTKVVLVMVLAYQLNTLLLSIFILHNVLHVPQISNNLTFVHKFTYDTNTTLEFHPSYFHVKDLALGRILLRGPSRHGLYPFSSYSNKWSLFPTTIVGEQAPLYQWHS
jgi:hypothetical protein